MIKSYVFPHVCRLSFFPPRHPHRSRERMRGGKAHVRRRNGRAISVDMWCLKTATIRRRQPERFFSLSFLFFLLRRDAADKGTRGKSGNYIPVRDNAIGFLVTRYTWFRSIIQHVLNERTNENAAWIRATGFTRHKTFGK